MISAESAIRKYRRKLTPELVKRYGGSGPYTRAQVDVTVRELRLSNRHIQYAYAIFCEREVLAEENVPDSVVAEMQKSIAAAGTRAVATSISAFFIGGEGDGGGFGDGGGGDC